MTASILILLCVLLLLAYVFDISASKTRVPAVILLLALGWGLRQLTNGLGVAVPEMQGTLPLLGTVGLILIVLEGSLELKVSRENAPEVRRAAVMAVLPLVVMAALLAWVFHALAGAPPLVAVTQAVPFAVISSAIAIPTAKHFSAKDRSFVTYESSLSDIVGVMVFNFVALNSEFGWGTFGHFGLELLIIVAASFVGTLGLAFLLSRIHHHVKFAPIVILTILIYAIAKAYHLPGLLVIMAFGMFLSNASVLTEVRWLRFWRLDSLDSEVHRLKDLVAEGAFLVRSVFFLVFGFQIETASLLEGDTWLWSLGICLAIVLVRWVFLKLMRIRPLPLLFIAPRGLVTVLLYLSIPAERAFPLVSPSMVTQVVLISSLMMMLGTLTARREQA
ncbi:MAG: sodium:proton antiporter [Bacteroidia bacterium]